MRLRHLVLPLAIVCLGLGHRLTAADAPPAKPGYKVVVEIEFNEAGVSTGARVIESDDPTSDTILHRIAMTLAAQIKQPPHLKDGKPVKFTVRAPFDFPVDDDEGPAANDAPKPHQIGGDRPIYPKDLAAAGEVGGAILELNIGADGIVHKVKVMRASNPEFGAAAETAAKTWTYHPAMKDGVAVASRWRTAVAFSVDGKEVDWKWRVAPRPNLGGSVVLKLPPAAATPATAAPGTPAPAATPTAPQPAPAK